MTTFCPATMCPLFASDGSPWTGDKDAPCGNSACAWFQGGKCEGRDAADEQIAMAADGKGVFQIGTHAKRQHATTPKDYDCPRAHECQWQIEAEKEGGICPPRCALRLGLDPRLSGY